MPDKPKSDAWYIRIEDGIAGPYSTEQLKRLVKDGTVDKHSPIRSEGGDRWIRAGQFPAIFGNSETVLIPASSSFSPRIEDPQSLQPPPMRMKQAEAARRHSQWNTASVATVVAVLTSSLAAVAIFVFVSQGPKTTARATPDNGEQPKASATQSSVDSHAPPPNPPTTSDPTQTSFTSEQIVAMTEGSVATVIAGEGIGSGFVVSNGIVATNYHVIADDEGERISCIFTSASPEQRGPVEAGIIAEDPTTDLALLKIESTVKPLKVTQNNKPRRGQSVIAIGTPALFKGEDMLPNALTHGIVSSEHQLFGVPRYQLAMTVNPGNSGGPVIGLDGTVIGVVVSKSKTEEGIAFCVPASSLLELLNSYDSNKLDDALVVRSQHRARVTARELAKLTLALELFLNRLANAVESKSGASARQLSASAFSELVSQVMLEVEPGLKKNFASQLETISSDENLQPRLRTELKTLLDRHLALYASLSRPRGNVQNMMNSIANLRDRFLEQLRRVNALLPLGVPELME